MKYIQMYHLMLLLITSFISSLTIAKIKEEIAATVSQMKQQNQRVPHLVAVLVGMDGASV